MDLSVIVPCYNEQECLPLLFDRVVGVFGAEGLDYELVFVNDGSKDRTWALIEEFCASGRAPHVKAVDFSRNFGKEPETLVAMYRELMAHPEADVVAAYQSARHESKLQAALKEQFYRTFRSLADGCQGMVSGASDFRVFRQDVARALLSMPEYFRFSKGLFAWVGFETIPFAYEPAERAGGTSKWSLRKLMAYAMDGIFAFSTVPLKLATGVGALASLAAVVSFLGVLWDTFVLRNTPHGYPTMVCLLLLFGGMILLTLGIIGEYLARIYLEGKHRPVFIAKRTLSAEDGEVTRGGFERN